MEITGGNWKVGKHSSCVVTDDKSAVDFEKRYTPESLKYYGGALIAESCRKADAKLITAAPEMLELLQSIENDAGQVPEWLWLRIKEVIKKATG